MAHPLADVWTLRDRARAYNERFAQWPASHLVVVREQGQEVIYGRWVLGQNYQAPTKFYGAYPPGFLDRVLALFPDVAAADTLHVFSGSLHAGEYVRCDLVQPAELPCSVYDLPALAGRTFALVLADPPYSKADAEKYTTPAIDRAKALAAIGAVTDLGGHLAWLDTCWPMHSKRTWRTVGRVAITRSTNHRTRDLTVFQRVV